MHVSLEQFIATGDPQDNLAVIMTRLRHAAARGAELIVFPEAAMKAFGSGRLDTVAESLDGPFATAIHEEAVSAGVTVVVGMFTPADTVTKNGKVVNRIFNTALVTGPGIHCGYHKIHCYDAFGYRESDTVKPGHELVTFHKAGLTIGVAICYDIRFPEQFIALARDKKADAIVVPASFSDGPGKKEQWRTLTTARALDSTAWILASGQARPNYRSRAHHHDGPTGLGFSAVIDPTGRRVAELGYAPGYVDAVIDPLTVDKARREIPVIAPGARRAFR